MAPRGKNHILMKLLVHCTTCTPPPLLLKFVPKLGVFSLAWIPHPVVSLLLPGTMTCLAVSHCREPIYLKLKTYATVIRQEGSILKFIVVVEMALSASATQTVETVLVCGLEVDTLDNI
jgi:hypothetical protein